MADSFTLGGEEHPLDTFTLGDVMKLAPLFCQGGISTPAETSAMATAIHLAVSKNKPGLSFADFQALPNVTITELQRAYQAIGLKIGFFALKQPDAGASSGEAETEKPIL